MIKYIKNTITHINKQIFIRNFLFILSVTTIYSLSVNLPLINMQYPEKYFLLAFAVSIFRDFIIWLIAFLNKWVFALFTLLTFIAGFGLMYMNKYLNMDLSTGNFEIIFATNINEAKGVLNIILITHFVAGLLLALIFIYLRFKLFKKSNSMPGINNYTGGGMAAVCPFTNHSFYR